MTTQEQQRLNEIQDDVSGWRRCAGSAIFGDKGGIDFASKKILNSIV